MEQIRIHGRGGQGVVTAAELIAIAAFDNGKYAQAFPHFGVERSGAPVQSYARISDEKIITREQIYNPDILIIQDASLLETEKNILVGTNKDTLFIINAPHNYQSPIKLPSKKVFYTPATEIALKIFGKNIVNTVILGSFAKHAGLITLESLKSAVSEKFSDKGEAIIKKNIQAIESAFND